MTLPDGPGFYERLDLEAARRRYNGIDWNNQHHDPLWFIEELIKVALVGVVPAVTEGWCQRGEGHHDGPKPGDRSFGECGTKWSYRRFVSEWVKVEEEGT